MLLSIIIVSYNVKHYLRQCLKSIYASEGINHDEVEVFVVDNHSSDGTVPYLREYFPTLQIIENLHNVGFGRANNQALAKVKGKFTLFLNPDTVLTEHTLADVLQYYHEKEAEGRPIGAAGVRMLGSNGCFAPESKRGIPTPWVCCCKMLGLHRLFPHRKAFNQYYLGFLSDTAPHSVPSLSGACLFAPTDLLRQLDGFDEQFFMYGEDIDLSYRILLSGHENYYIPTSILHYKGESTRKKTYRYVQTFYKAMLLFYQKHFARTTLWLWLPVVAAIFLKAALALCSNCWHIFRFRLWPERSNARLRFLYLGTHAADILPFTQQHPIEITPYEASQHTHPEGHNTPHLDTKPYVHAIYDLRDYSRTNILRIFNTAPRRSLHIGFYDHDAQQIITGGEVFTL